MSLWLTYNAVSADENKQQPHFSVVDWFPFGWIEDDTPKGLFVDLSKVIGEALGYKAKIIVAPTPRVLRGMEAGEFDFAITYRDPVMLKHVSYIIDIGCLNSMVISLKEKPVRKLSDMNGLRVAFPKAGYFEANVLPHLTIEPIEVPQSYMMFRMALRNRVDAFVINNAVWSTYAKANNFPQHIASSEEQHKFATPYVIATLPVALSVTRSSVFYEDAKMLLIKLRKPHVQREITKILSSYGLEQELSCPTLVGPNLSSHVLRQIVR